MSKSTGGARKGLCILAGRKKATLQSSSDLAEGKQIRQWVSVRRVRPTTTAGGLLGMRDQGGINLHSDNSRVKVHRTYYGTHSGQVQYRQQVITPLCI